MVGRGRGKGGGGRDEGAWGEEWEGIGHHSVYWQPPN